MDDATVLCTKVLNEGREGFDLCWQFAANLPAESLAEAIASVWINLDEAIQREILDRQQRLPEKTPRLRLRSAVALRSIDATAARRLLSSACYTMTKTPKKRPNKEQTKLFRSVLLSGDEPALVGFTFQSSTQAEIAPLLACVLEVLSARSVEVKRPFSPSEPRMVEWLLQNDFFSRLTEEQCAVVAVLVKSWPHDVKVAFASKHERLPESLNITLRPAGNPSQVVANGESAQPPTASEPTVEQPRNASVRELLDQVSAAVKTIEAEKKGAFEKLREKESTLQELRTKLRQAETRSLAAEGELLESRAALHEVNAALQTASAELAEVRSKLAANEQELVTGKEKHSADSQALLDRIEVEKKRAVESYENRLADKLRLEWRDFESVNNLPMDIQVGESMRALVRGIFEMLEHEGIKIRN